MAEHTENQQAPAKGIDHRLEALVLLGGIRPPAGSDEAIASAQVHAMLAMAEAQVDVARLLSMATRELNAANMFKLASVLEEDNPLRTVIQNGLLHHLTRDGAVHTDITLSARIKELGLEVKAGDDIVVTSSDGKESHELLVVDPAGDQWLLLGREDLDPENAMMTSPRIHAMFDADIRSLMVTVKKIPKE
ncbi:hypothetical protein [Arthrobacter sp. AD-310]